MDATVARAAPPPPPPPEGPPPPPAGPQPPPPPGPPPPGQPMYADVVRAPAPGATSSSSSSSSAAAPAVRAPTSSASSATRTRTRPTATRPAPTPIAFPPERVQYYERQLSNLYVRRQNAIAATWYTGGRPTPYIQHRIGLLDTQQRGLWRDLQVE